MERRRGAEEEGRIEGRGKERREAERRKGRERCKGRRGRQERKEGNGVRTSLQYYLLQSTVP